VPLYQLDIVAGELTPVSPTNFTVQQVKERQDLQRALRSNIQVLGDDLLVVAEEYGEFADSRRRIDLLALDRAGHLVVIEVKRTEDGGHMELQALRYAAMVSTMTFDQLIDTYAEHAGVNGDEARSVVLDHVEDEGLAELSTQVRIVLVSADFTTEITATVLWLNEQYGLDIQCWRLSPYSFRGELLLDVQQVIPLPEAETYRIHQRRKGASAELSRAGGEGRDYSKYIVSVDGTDLGVMSKQRAIMTAVKQLVNLGVPADALRERARGRRWFSVTPAAGETVEQSFRREYPDSGGNYWFDLDMHEGDRYWVMPKLGGLRTEEHLDALTALGEGRLTWRRVEDDDA
jgi:hypothetical protein